MKKETSFEEKLSEIMQTIPGDKETILPDLSAIFGGAGDPCEPFGVGGYKREVEDEEQYQLFLKVRDDVSKEAEEIYLKNNPHGFSFGSCHAIWAIEKRIYREKYGIDWHTPQEMNPTISFD